MVPEDTIITTEVGQNQMWTALWYTFRKPRTLLTSGGLGTMGFGFPAAIGAQAAWPDRLVIDIAGDGSIQMNIQELATVVQHELPVKVLILNNGYLGMVRQWQELFYKKRYSHSLKGDPDFVKVAEAYGARGFRVTEPKDVNAALDQMIRTEGPVFLDVVVAPEENVFPIVPAGQAINRMMGGWPDSRLQRHRGEAPVEESILSRTAGRNAALRRLQCITSSARWWRTRRASWRTSPDSSAVAGST